MEFIHELSMAGIIPVIKVNRADDAVPLCRALVKGGLPVAEITFRTAAAVESIARVHDQLPDVLLGAGTVLTCEQVDAAVAAGAAYIVSPGINPAVVRRCQEHGIPVLPGCANPTDIETALSLGVKTVKFFPAEALGGLPMIKAMGAPYGDVRFVPTGGINEKNLNDYLASPKVAACGGSWMVPESAIAAGDWDKIESLARAAVEKMLGFELVHVGINAGDASQEVSQQLCALTGFASRETSKGYFAGGSFEIMRGKGPGTHGHLAIGTSNVERAVWHLKRRGYAFDESSARYKDGRMNFIYLRDEIAGFSIHLVAK